MTPGEAALHEAARLESARIYGRTLSPERAPLVPSVVEAFTAGYDDAQLRALYGWDDETCREARKDWMRRAS